MPEKDATRWRNWFAYLLALYVLIVILVRLFNPPPPGMPITTKKSFSPTTLEESDKTLPPSSGSQSLSSDEVIRRSRVIAGEDALEDVFSRAGRVIARQKVSAKGIEEKVGEIPDGVVKFFDESQRTHGQEHYRSGQKDGLVRTYYEDGRLNSESLYRHGKLLTKKEYYKSGVLRLDVNYTQARVDKDNKETGIGKLYFPNGTLKYEWNLTRSSNPGFKKSYDRNGQLTFEAHYDQEGSLIESH